MEAVDIEEYQEYLKLYQKDEEDGSTASVIKWRTGAEEKDDRPEKFLCLLL